MKKKLLVVIQLIRRGGVELAAVNFAKNLDKSKFDISFLLLNPYEPQDDALKQELVLDGCKIINMPENAGGYFGKYKFIKNLIKNEKYDAVHSHTIFFSGIVLMAAKRCGVKVRAAHSHTIKWNRQENLPYKLYKYVMRFLLNINANYKLACSQAAGDFLYGEKAYRKHGQFIANAINIAAFSYNCDSRQDIRKAFNISQNQLLVGHVGSIYKIKNQTFLIDIFSEIIKKRPDAKLILVGEIFDKDPVAQKIEQYNLQDKVIFAGSQKDISKFYSAMDIMIFPSLHEALPLSLIEAQASKLPCLVSDTVTKEVKFNENVDFLPLSAAPSVWADEALSLIKTDRQSVCTDELCKVYDIKSVSAQLEQIYLSE